MRVAVTGVSRIAVTGPIAITVRRIAVPAPIAIAVSRIKRAVYWRERKRKVSEFGCDLGRCRSR